jgi:hypothetical protein
VLLLLGISKHGENDVRFVALKVFCTVHLKRDLDSLINGNLDALHISFFPLINLFTVCKDSLREEL